MLSEFRGGWMVQSTSWFLHKQVRGTTASDISSHYVAVNCRLLHNIQSHESLHNSLRIYIKLIDEAKQVSQQMCQYLICVNLYVSTCDAYWHSLHFSCCYSSISQLYNSQYYSNSSWTRENQKLKWAISNVICHFYIARCYKVNITVARVHVFQSSIISFLPPCEMRDADSLIQSSWYIRANKENKECDYDTPTDNKGTTTIIKKNDLHHPPPISIAYQD